MVPIRKVKPDAVYDGEKLYRLERKLGAPRRPRIKGP